MATWTIKFYPFNLLELGAVTVTGTPDTGYPVSRLYDRESSLFWKDTVTEAKNFVVDQGATPVAVDFLAIPKHNFSGVAMQWQYSTDNFSSSIVDAVTDWTQGDNSQIIKTLSTAQSIRYWRVTIASMVNPQCSEIYMSKGFSFNALRDGNPTGQDQDNVQWNRTAGDVERSTKRGDKRRVRDYTFMLSAAELADFETVINYTDDYSKPFYIKDHRDAYYMARFLEKPHYDYNHNTHTRVKISLIEKL